MPAHGAAATIGNALRSDGNVVTSIAWRGNRLADALAKAAIGIVPLCVAAEKLVATAETLVRHECAVLGASTHAANHHALVVTEASGLQRLNIARDSVGIKRTSTYCRRSIPETACRGGY